MLESQRFLGPTNQPQPCTGMCWIWTFLYNLEGAHTVSMGMRLRFEQGHNTCLQGKIEVGELLLPFMQIQLFF